MYFISKNFLRIGIDFFPGGLHELDNHLYISGTKTDANADS